MLLGSKNTLHNNYQDFQMFLDAGGKIGLQHDPLLYGAYLLNPFLVHVEMVPMLVVNQGEVAVIKAYVGLPTLDTSGDEFKFGSIVRPGHRGIWQEPLRTGKYPINPRVYAAEIVPTSILTLNWAEAVSQAHNLDAHLTPIEAKSREGFVFRIDLQVQIHVPDTRAPKVISMVGTMQNLVNEVLQSAVGNHFRNTLQELEAVQFIETRAQVQQSALEAITAYLAAVRRRDARRLHPGRRVPRRARHRADPARDRQPGEGDVRRAAARADGARRDGEGEGHGRHAGAARAVAGGHRHPRTTKRKRAKRRREVKRRTSSSPVGPRPRRSRRSVSREAKATEALGLARAEGFQAQTEALGEMATALVAVANAVADGHITIVPEVLVTGGGGGALDGLAATLMRTFGTGGNGERPVRKTIDQLVVPGEELPEERRSPPNRQPPPRHVTSTYSHQTPIRHAAPQKVTSKRPARSRDSVLAVVA